MWSGMKTPDPRGGLTAVSSERRKMPGSAAAAAAPICRCRIVVPRVFLEIGEGIVRAGAIRANAVRPGEHAPCLAAVGVGADEVERRVLRHELEVAPKVCRARRVVGATDPNQTDPGSTRTNPTPIRHAPGARRARSTGGDRRRPEATGGDRRRPEATGGDRRRSPREKNAFLFKKKK